LGRDLAIDLGTANTLVYRQGEGIVFDQPTVIALNTRSGDVLAQFLLESILLSVTGGLLGILIGYLVSGSISKFVQWSTSVSPLSVAISFGISAAVGIFFGYYPARQASRVLPITSLRYE